VAGAIVEATAAAGVADAAGAAVVCPCSFGL